MSNIRLADAIEYLRRELGESISKGNDAEVQFDLGPIELELEVKAEKQKGVEGGVKWWLVSGKAGAKTASAVTQKLKLTLEPIGSDASRLRIKGSRRTRPK